jgi:hypothetical protein
MEQFFQNYRSYAQVGTAPKPPCMRGATAGDFRLSAQKITLPPRLDNTQAGEIVPVAANH